jgi:hypothetical protein
MTGCRRADRNMHLMRAERLAPLLFEIYQATALSSG